MHGARRFLAHESRSKYTFFLRKWQGYLKKTAYFWLIICFLVYLQLKNEVKRGLHLFYI